MGCTSVRKTMDSWKGHHKSELIRSWGPPSQVVSDGNNGEILIYRSGYSYQTPGAAYSNGYGSLTYTSPTVRNVVSEKQFYIDERGYIYYWRVIRR